MIDALDLRPNSSQDLIRAVEPKNHLLLMDMTHGRAGGPSTAGVSQPLAAK